MVKLNAKSLVCVPPEDLSEQIPKATNLQWLCLARSFCYGPDAIIDGCRKTTGIEYLDLQGKGLSPDEVNLVLESTPKMQTFLFNCYYFSQDMSAWLKLVHIDYKQVKFTNEIYSRIGAFLNFRPFYLQ